MTNADVIRKMTDVLGKISEVPTIEVSEDCISRKWLFDKAESNFDELGEDYDINFMLRDIKNAPSVTTEQSSMVGEWVACTKEGLPLTELGRRERQKWHGYKCSKCNFIYKGNALTESPFCQNCGAKMKG